MNMQLAKTGVLKLLPYLTVPVFWHDNLPDGFELPEIAIAGWFTRLGKDPFIAIHNPDHSGWEGEASFIAALTHELVHSTEITIGRPEIPNWNADSGIQEELVANSAALWLLHQLEEPAAGDWCARLLKAETLQPGTQLELALRPELMAVATAVAIELTERMHAVRNKQPQWRDDDLHAWLKEIWNG